MNLDIDFNLSFLSHIYEKSIYRLVSGQDLANDFTVHFCALYIIMT